MRKHWARSSVETPCGERRRVAGRAEREEPGLHQGGCSRPHQDRPESIAVLRTRNRTRTRLPRESSIPTRPSPACRMRHMSCKDNQLGAANSMAREIPLCIESETVRRKERVSPRHVTRSACEAEMATDEGRICSTRAARLHLSAFILVMRRWYRKQANEY